MKRVFTMQLSLIFIAIFVLTLGVPAVQATVEPGWPVSQPNNPRNADDIYLNFENGIEGIAIESTISSLKFTTTNGLNWRYGDVRTDFYNVDPYGTKVYETRGNFFAWLGESGSSGRIDFLGGGATYCSILVSTYSGVQIDAYDSSDVLIATSGNAGSNIETGTLTRLTVDAPTGRYIAYVVIHDSGNYWLMDELCTDANKIVFPVPGRSMGSNRFNIVFVPDTDYGSQKDIDTWLPIFRDHINHQIDERLGGAAPVSGNLDKFNFYYTKLQGTASSKTLPADLTKASPFADAYVIFHIAEFGDSTIMSNPSIYGAEGTVGRSFIHESGHGIFGVADEYDGCGTYYFEPSPNPNIWATQAAGQTDAAGEYAVPVAGQVLGTGDGTKVLFGPVVNHNSANAPNAFFADTDVDGDVDTGDVGVYIGGSKQTTDKYTISPASGTVTLKTAPPNGAAVTVDYSYVKDEDWNPFTLQKFTECQGGWWKVGTTKYIMFDGTQFANGWGKPAARRIQWVLDQYSSATAASSAKASDSPQAGKSIWLNLNLSAAGFNLLDDSYLTDSPPSYLPGTYDFTVKVYSTSEDHSSAGTYTVALNATNSAGSNTLVRTNYIPVSSVRVTPVAGFTGSPTSGTSPLTLLGEYGFNDPRRILAESDYDGPTFLDDANFQLILPYFNNGGRVDLIESATGSVKLSVDISKYATPDKYTPLANFTAIPTAGGAPLTVIFTDSSLNSPALWYWTFGDGSVVNASSQNPVHTYARVGTYTVSLNATNSAGSNTLTRTGYITVSSGGVAPVASFTGSPTSGTAPLTVTFTDSSTNTPTAWSWNFGDSSSVNATQRNPVHTYASAGTYTVALTATNSAGSNLFTRTSYITVTSDVTPPTIIITSPTANQKFTTATVTVKGTASDAGGLSKVQVRVGSGAWQTATGTTSWSTSVTLAKGSNKITARATDTSGNYKDASVTVTYTYTKDVTPPTITITYPKANQEFTKATVTISGTASDNVELSKVEVKVGPGVWQTATGTTSWSKLVILALGSNKVTARATDTSGNYKDASVTVTYNNLIL